MGPVVVLVPGAPAGLFVVCLLGGAGGREVCPQRSLWHQPVPEEKEQPLFRDGCCQFGYAAGQIHKTNAARTRWTVGQSTCSVIGTHT